MIEKQDMLIAEKNAEIMEKHSALEEVTMKLAEVETLADEVTEQAYEKACEVVADTVRVETRKEDMKILDDYSKWLSAPERIDDKKLRNYAVKCLAILKEKFVKSAKGINLLQGLDKITKTLQEPEKKNENLRQVKEKAREFIRERLARGKTEADRINQEQMQCEGKIKLTTKKDMEL